MFSKQAFQALDQRLQDLADDTYRQFHGKLIPGVTSVFYGVRVPQLRKIAKEICKQDWREFVKLAVNSDIYEMNMLCGMTIALSKCDFQEKLSYIKIFVPDINNWAVCDIVCGDLKDVKKHREVMFDFIQPYLKSEQEYEVRFGVVILMQYFLDEEYIDRVLTIYDSIQHGGYYVKMAVAWGISMCFVKCRDKTCSYLEICHLDDFTYNKSIQKMIESYRVSKEDKTMLRHMKRKAKKV